MSKVSKEVEAAHAAQVAVEAARAGIEHRIAFEGALAHLRALLARSESLVRAGAVEAEELERVNAELADLAARLQSAAETLRVPLAALRLYPITGGKVEVFETPGEAITYDISSDQPESLKRLAKLVLSSKYGKFGGA